MNQELLAAWKAWDAYPGAEGPARALASACVAYAGAQSIELRQHMAACRRDGLTHEAALLEWEILHGRPPA